MLCLIFSFRFGAQIKEHLSKLKRYFQGFEINYVFGMRFFFYVVGKSLQQQGGKIQK